MKRILILSLTLLFAFCASVYAAGVNGQYKGYDIVHVQFEGKELKPDDVPGILLDGRTMIPLGLLRKAGFTVEWDAKTLTANVTTKQPQPAKKPLTKAQIQALDKAVAYIEVVDENGIVREQGSGVIINSSGLLTTAYHVPEYNGKLAAMRVTVNGKTYNVPAGRYLFADEKKDIYGVFLDGDKFDFIRVNDELPAKDDTVYALGNPQGKRNILTEGKVMFAYEMVDRVTIGNDAFTEPGSSGGALINRYGELIGIITGGGDSFTSSTGIHDIKKAYEEAFNK